jgi:hypothetical protein
MEQCDIPTNWISEMVFLFFALPEVGVTWLQKFEHLKYILAYFIINCDVLVPIFVRNDIEVVFLGQLNRCM